MIKIQIIPDIHQTKNNKEYTMTDNNDPRKIQGREFVSSAMEALRENKITEAEEFFKKAMVIFEEFEMDKELATTYHMMGVCAQMRKDYSEAEVWFDKTVDIKGKIGSPPFMLDTIAQVGSMRLEQGFPEKALLHYGNAYLIAIKFNIPVFMRLLADLSNLLNIMGEEEFLKVWNTEFEGYQAPLEQMQLIMKPRELIESVMKGEMTREEFADKWVRLFPGMEPPI